jgi:SSS family solute:Na+ symporter
MVGQRFGAGARRIIALALAFVFLVWGGAEIYVAASLLAPGLGIARSSAILGIGLVVAIYATLGGFRAVVATDKLQYAIVALYVLAMAWLAFRGLRREGTMVPEPTLQGLHSGRPWTDLFAPGAAIIVLTFVAYIPGWVFETDLWVRVQAARSDRAARRGVLLAGVNALFFVGLLPLAIGVAALALFPLEGGASPAAVGVEGDAIFAALVERYAPTWLEVLVAMGLVAAAMSTIDTCANVMALAIGYDLFELHRRRNGARASRWVTAGALAAACVFALNTESLWDIFYLSGGVLSTAVAFPVAAVFLPWASARGVRFSALAGLVGTGLAYALESRGALAGIEPEWLAGSGLGFVLWGLGAAAVGYLSGAIGDSE